MTIQEAIEAREAAHQAFRAATNELTQAMREAREAGVTIPKLMELTGLSYRGVYLLLNRNSS